MMEENKEFKEGLRTVVDEILLFAGGEGGQAATPPVSRVVVY